MAIASLVLGILSFVLICCCCVSPILSILAIVFAFVAKSKNGGKMPGMATAGLVLGIVFWAVFIILLLTTVADFYIAYSADPEGFWNKMTNDHLYGQYE